MSVILNSQKVFVALCLFLFGPMVYATTISVPADFNSVTSAVLAAVTSDTIIITDSATYVGQVIINKRVKIVAASGQTPTLKNDGVTTCVITIADGGEGAIIGSVGGGTITLDGNNTEDEAVIQLSQGGSGLVTFENLNIVRPGSDGIRTHGTTGAKNAVFNRVSTDMAGADDEFLRPDAPFNGGTITFNRCTVVNAPYRIVYTNDTNVGNGTITFNECSLQAARELIHLQGVTAGKSWVFNVNYTFFHATGTEYGIRVNDVYTGGPATINLSHSVILEEAYQAIMVEELPTSITLNIDHCDVITKTTGREDIRIKSNTGNNVNVAVTNSNVFCPTNDDGLNVDNAGAGLITTNHNNYYAKVGGEVDGGGGVAGPNDIIPGLDPLYTNATGKVYTYTNATVLAGDSTGHPIGTDLDFSDIIDFTPAAPVVVSGAKKWTIYN